MKTPPLLMIFIFIFYSFTVFSQTVEETEVPIEVINSFKKRCPDVSEVKWEKNKKNFNASFVKEKKIFVSSFNKNGDWKKTDLALKKDAVPNQAFKFLKEKYNEFTLEEVALEQNPDGKYYRIIITNKMGEFSHFFDLDGNYVEKDRSKN